MNFWVFFLDQNSLKNIFRYLYQNTLNDIFRYFFKIILKIFQKAEKYLFKV